MTRDDAKPRYSRQRHGATIQRRTNTGGHCCDGRQFRSRTEKESLGEQNRSSGQRTSRPRQGPVRRRPSQSGRWNHSPYVCGHWSICSLPPSQARRRNGSSKQQVLSGLTRRNRRSWVQPRRCRTQDDVSCIRCISRHGHARCPEAKSPTA